MFAPVNNNPEFWLMQEEAKTWIPISLSTWLSYKNIPIVCVEEKSSGVWVTQIEDNFFKLTPTYYWIPTNIMTETIHEYSSKMWLTAKDSFYFTDFINPDDWKIIDIQQAGDYLLYKIIES